MDTRKTPPANGLSAGPIIVACQWNISSATGPVGSERLSLQFKYISSTINQNIYVGIILKLRVKNYKNPISVQTPQ